MNQAGKATNTKIGTIHTGKAKGYVTVAGGALTGRMGGNSLQRILGGTRGGRRTKAGKTIPGGASKTKRASTLRKATR